MADVEREPKRKRKRKTERKRKHKRWWRWLWRVPLALVGLILVTAIGVLVAVLWIPAASQFAARTALERWDAVMPGTVEWSAMSGRLGDGLRIDDFELRDDQDRPLVRVAAVEVDLDASKLLRLEAALERGEIDDAEIWVDHEWRALAPSGQPARRERPVGMGPDLPLRLRAHVEIDGAHVVRDDRTLVRAEAVTVSAFGFGREAEAEITIADAELPDQDLRVDDLALVAAWSAPVATLRTLDVHTPLGWAQLIEPAHFDARERRGAVDLHVEGDLDALAARIDTEQLAQLEAATADLHAEFSIEDGAILRGQAKLGDGGELAVVGFHAAAASLGLRDAPLNARAYIQLHAPGTTAVAALSTSADEGLAAHLSLDVHELGALGEILAPRLDQPELARLRGAIALRADCTGDDARVRCLVKLRAGDLAGYGARIDHVELRAELELGGEHPRFDATLEADELRRGDLVLRRAVVTARGTPARLHVQARARGSHEHGEITAWIHTGAPLRIDLERLHLVSTRTEAPARVELQRPARIVVGRERVDVHDLEVDIVGGELRVDGHLDLAGTNSDLRVTLDRLDLDRLDRLVPGPHVQGVVDLDASFRGGLARPAGWLTVTARDLVIADLHLGALDLRAQLCGQQPASSGAPAFFPDPCAADELRVRVHGGGLLAEAVDLDARAPIRFAPRPGLRPGPPIHAQLAIRGLDLVELGAWMPATPEFWRQIPADASAPEGDPRLIPEGEVDVDLRVAGTASAPELDLTVVARELVIDRTELGSLLARATLRDDQLGIELDAKPGFASLELDASVPVRVDLIEPRVELRPEAEHQLSAELHNLDLRDLADTLGPKLPELDRALTAAELDARVSASIRGRGSLDEPELHARVRAHGLRHRDELLGRARVKLDAEGARTDVEIELDGPLARRLDLRAELPVSLALRDRERWLQVDSEAPIHAEVHVDALAVARLAPHVDALPFVGEASLDAELSGSLTGPELDLVGTVSELRLANGPVGELGFRARADAQTSTLEADLVREGAHVLALELEVPIEVALAGLASGRSEPVVRWARERNHRIMLAGREFDDDLIVALGGPRLGTDRALPGQFEVATTLGFDLGGGGTIDNFQIRGQLHGAVEADGETTLELDGQIALDERAQRVELRLTPSTCDQLLARLELDANVPDLLDGRQEAGRVPFILLVDAPDFDLGTLSPILPRAVYGPEGELHGQVRGSGVIAAPELSGELHLEDAGIVVLALRQRLQNIDLDLHFDRGQVELRELAVDVGGGHVRGQGNAEVRRHRGVTATLDLDIDDVPLVRPGLPLMTLTTDIDVQLDLDPETARLAIGLANLEVEVDKLRNPAPKRIPRSAAIDFVAKAEVDDEIQIQEVDMGETVDSPNLDFEFVLRDPAYIHGQAVDMLWIGSLSVLREDHDVELGGELEARRGSIELLGHRFDLRRGLVTMPASGELIPYLDILATTSTSEGEVEVTITGPADAPELHFSAGALDEYQIVTLLVTGSTSIADDNREVQARAANLLAAISSPQLRRQLDRSLGIDRVRLGFGETVDQPILTVGKRITENVLVETTYHHNAPEDENTAELGIEYNFARRWSLETYFGDAAVGGIGVYWTMSFPARRRRDRSSEPDPAKR